MYRVDYTNRFKKDLKRCIKRGLDARKIYEAVRILEADGKLPPEYKPHILSGIGVTNGNVISNPIGL